MKLKLNTFLSFLKNDNPRAFKLLYELYYDKLCHVAFSYLRNMEDAEEIVQNVFIKVWEKRENIETLTSSYLYTLTKNACLDFIKRPKLIISDKDFYDQQLSNPVAFITNDIASEIIAMELDAKIKKTIEELPQMQKEVFVKSRFEGIKNEDIAIQFGISKRTVDTHIYLAVKHMKSRLKDYLV